MRVMAGVWPPVRRLLARQSELTSFRNVSVLRWRGWAQATILFHCQNGGKIMIIKHEVRCESHEWLILVEVIIFYPHDSKVVVRWLLPGWEICFGASKIAGHFHDYWGSPSPPPSRQSSRSWIAEGHRERARSSLRDGARANRLCQPKFRNSFPPLNNITRPRGLIAGSDSRQSP